MSTQATTLETTLQSPAWAETQAVNTIAEDPLDIFRKASVLQLQFRRYGTSRKVQVDAIDIPQRGAAEQTDKKLVHVRKRILDSPELLLIEQHDGQTARWVDTKKAGPAFANQGGFHLIPMALQPELDAYLDERVEQRQPLIADFLDTLEQRIRETSRRLGPLARDVDYKRGDAARNEFAVTRAWITLGYRDRAAAQRWQAEALAECRATLREAFARIMQHMAERLQPAEDGRPRIFRDSLIENFDAFVADFSARNLADDSDLATLVQQSRRLMTGIDAEMLRTQGDLRRVVGQAVDQINDIASALVADKPTRYYGE